MQKAILYPTDGSPTAKKALGFAIDIAEAHKAEIIILSVIEKPIVSSLIEDTEEVEDTEEIEELYHKIAKEHMKEAKKHVGEAKKEAERKGIKARTMVVVADHASSEIVKIAEEQKVMAIVMGTHGRSDFIRAILGSIATKVSQMASCPVILVPCKK